MFVGFDVGAETVKMVCLESAQQTNWDQLKRWRRPHQKEPQACCLRMLSELVEECNAEGKTIDSVAVTGRFADQFLLPRIPIKTAQCRALSAVLGDDPVTLVAIGCRGFSVLEKRNGENDILRENSRCSQGTGNFLRQLVERFDFNLKESDALCENVENPSPLSGRCPVILKTDMTHLANKGEQKDEILAGVYDAICENVQALIKPMLCPKRLLISGGVTQSARIQKQFRNFCAKHGLEYIESTAFTREYLEALGCALFAAENAMEGKACQLPDDLSDVLRKNVFSHRHLDRLSPLSEFLPSVLRIEKIPNEVLTQKTSLIMGLDMGSTGSKAVAINADSQNVVWEGYVRTNGNPIHAAKQLVADYIEKIGDLGAIVAFGVTGSGREIVGSLLSSCFGSSNVYILNEIAAHAEGARTIDPRVDTIFEIGGQDAKYIRLEEGRIVDAAMNEACSAGTGSFIEEQGRKFKGVQHVEQLSEIALKAPYVVGLGQHCSVFMTEVIDEAIASGVEVPAIIAGIFDSIIQNYFHRVKGNRTVGNFVFCQGMPFSSDALAAAVVRQTGASVIVPPNPGTIGAFGIALLARRACLSNCHSLDLNVAEFLNSEIVEKTTFVCKSTKGCGGKGNRCKIDRIRVRQNNQMLNFTWGGACSLWDKGSHLAKLPDRCPDPFKERAERIEAIEAEMPRRGNRPCIAIAEEFQTKTLFVFFARFFYEMGFDIEVFRGGQIEDIKRGLDESNVRFCAPMQHFHGVAARMKESSCDLIFLPMMREGKRKDNEEYSVICPIVQSSADLLIHDLQIPRERIISPVFDLGQGNLSSPAFMECCRKLANSLNVYHLRWMVAYKRAVDEQNKFDADYLEIGRRALAFSRERGLTTVVVLGRNYTIYNDALNSNVPALLRGQGAMAIPVDCYPVSDEIPCFDTSYWTYGQINLRAAQQIRMQSDVYALWCSNYSCGPDSFNLHFFSYIMQGKPFTVIETDGHSGDAGTKTRIEAFLHCIAEEKEGEATRPESSVHEFTLHELEQINSPLMDGIRSGAILLMPPLGDDAKILSAAFRSVGMKVETLPIPTRKTLLTARRYTSGKECLPAQITLGSLLERVENRKPDEHFVFFMPRSNGPCRLGCYNLLDKIIVDRLKLNDIVKVWSLADTDYSEGVPMIVFIIVMLSFVVLDVIMMARYQLRPAESVKGETEAVYQKYFRKIEALNEMNHDNTLWQLQVAREISTKRFFGLMRILKDAAAEFSAIKARANEDIPTVCLTGEIYVRCDPFANDFIIESLEKRGIRVMFAHFMEWIEYADVTNHDILKTAKSLTEKISSSAIRYCFETCYRPMAKALGWKKRHTVPQILDTASPYLRKDLVGEEILTIGTPLTAWRKGEIEGVVSVGPLECMPSKIAESQFYHIAEREGLLCLNLSFNGDPIPESVIDDFAFEVHRRFQEKKRQKA